ncbi:MAG: hypothetical protein KatS3mg055_0027 [Chloroflexus sp.]|nr:MAG: hypothetical protein KatS3mg055_0027 [Chloroflexus sp.]
MGVAPRCPDANRHTVVGVGARYGMGGTVGRGTACRAPTIMGDPSGRPYDGRRDAMGDVPCRPDANRHGCGGTAGWARHAVMPWWGDGWDTVRPVGGTVCRGDPAGRPYDGQPYAMGDAPRRSDAHRDGRMGTAYRTPPIVGNPAGRPYDGRRTRWATHAMGDARDG